MFAVTVVAIAKVIVAVCIGALTCRNIPDASVTIRDFTFIVANVLLPSLTFYNTALSVNRELLVRSFILIIFSIVVIGLGLLCGVVSSKVLYPVRRTGIPHELRHSLRYTLIYENAKGCRASKKERRQNRESQRQREREEEHQGDQNQQQQQQHKNASLQPVVCIVLSGELEKQRVKPREVLPLIEPPGAEYEEQPFYYYGTLVACSIQNCVTLPLSLIQSLSTTVAWIDLAVSTSYMFIYSVVASAYFWSAGPMMVEKGKRETERRRTIRHQLELHKKLQNSRDVATQTLLRRDLSRMASPNHPMSLPIPIPIRPISTPPPPSSPSSPSSFSSSSSSSPSSSSSFSSAAVLTAAVSGSVLDGATSTAEPATLIETHSTGEQTDLHTDMDPGPLLAEQGFCRTYPYNWRKRGIIRVVYSSQFKDESMAKPTVTSVLAGIMRTTKSTGLWLLRTPAFTSIIAGFIVGIVPPLRWLMFEGPLALVMDSIALVSQGSIPASLLLLGTNLAYESGKKATVTEVRLREAEQNTELPLEDETEEPTYRAMYNAAHESIEFDEHASFTLVGLQQEEQRQRELQQRQQQVHDNARDSTLRGTNSATVVVVNSSSSSSSSLLSGVYGVFKNVRNVFLLDGIRKSFVFGVLFIRLLLIPAIGFTLVLLLRLVAPSLFGGKGGHDVLLLVLLAELAAPTAINCVLLFNTSRYMPGVWAKMLFYQYICCAFSFMLWYTLSLSIAS